MGTILLGMPSHRLTLRCSVASWFALLSITAVQPAVAHGPPERNGRNIKPEHRRFLSSIARRTVRDAALKRPEYEPGYVPKLLQQQQAEVVVRLREGGFLITYAAAGPKPLAHAVRDAALIATRQLATFEDFGLDFANDALIEIEVIGQRESFEVRGDWTQPRVIDPFLEPGVHGLALDGKHGRHRFSPTELITKELVLADALTQWAKTSRTNPSELADVKLARFRTQQWYQPQVGADIVSLHRGLVAVPMESITPQRLDQSIEQLVDYMLNRQLDSGLFRYLYLPSRDEYSEEDNLVRQAGATMAMAMYGRVGNHRPAMIAADRAIRFHLQGLNLVPGDESAAYIATKDQSNKLGLTALICLALGEHRHAEQYAGVRAKLVKGMLHLQRPSGMFITAFPPATKIDAQEYFPGEALLALASHYAHDPSAEILDAFSKALSFYHDYFRRTPAAAFVPWQVQAYARMARFTRRRDYVDFVFELCDWLAEKQLTRTNCEWPELRGGIAPYGNGRVGVATAAYLEAFADALVLARDVHDEQRVRQYTQVVRWATRFVVQLQVKPQEAYFARSPKDMVGGIRSCPSLNLLRIDHCQHALVALIMAKQALYPERD